MASKQPFKIGDIVQLLSGGPKMTVTGIRWVVDKDWQTGTEKDAYWKVDCVWFAGAKESHADFLPAVLKIADDKGK